jgi:hypothetical protein
MKGLGRSRRGFSCKIHLRCNGLGEVDQRLRRAKLGGAVSGGLPVALVLTGGQVLTGDQVSDAKGYAPLMAEPGPVPKVMLGDKGLRCQGDYHCHPVKEKPKNQTHYRGLHLCLA